MRVLINAWSVPGLKTGRPLHRSTRPKASNPAPIRSTRFPGSGCVRSEESGDGCDPGWYGDSKGRPGRAHIKSDNRSSKRRLSAVFAARRL